MIDPAANDMKIVFSAILLILSFLPPTAKADVQKGAFDIFLKGGLGLMLNGGGDIGLQYANQKDVWQSRYFNLPSPMWDWNSGNRNIMGDVSIGLV